MLRQSSGPLAAGKPAGWRGGASPQRATPSRLAASFSPMCAPGQRFWRKVPAMPRHPDFDWLDLLAWEGHGSRGFHHRRANALPICAGVGHLPAAPLRLRPRRSASSIRPHRRGPGITTRDSDSTSTGSSSSSGARWTRITGWPVTGFALQIWTVTGWEGSCGRRSSTSLKRRSYRCAGLYAWLHAFSDCLSAWQFATCV